MTRNITIATTVFLAISALGFLDATYLTVEHYRGSIPPCTISGCEIVLTSDQSTIVGIPVALVGAAYYLALLIAAIASLDRKKESLIKLASRMTPFGFAASAYFVYLQFFVIKAICQYCMISAGTSTLLFMTGVYIIIATRHSRMA